MYIAQPSPNAMRDVRVIDKQLKSCDLGGRSFSSDIRMLVSQGF